MKTSHTLDSARELWELTFRDRQEGDNRPVLLHGTLTVHADGSAEYHEGDYHWTGHASDLLKEFMPDGWKFKHSGR